MLPHLSAGPQDDADTPAVVCFKRLRGQIFVQSRLHVLTAVYEAVTHRVYGRTFPLKNDPQYWDALSSLSAVASAQDSSQVSHAVPQPTQVLVPQSYAAVVASLPRQAPLGTARLHLGFSQLSESQDSNLASAASAAPSPSQALPAVAGDSSTPGATSPVIPPLLSSPNHLSPVPSS